MAKPDRCEPAASLRGAQARLTRYRLGDWVSVRLEGRQVVRTEDAAARLQGVRLVCLGEPALGLWRLADSYPAAQTPCLRSLPK